MSMTQSGLPRAAPGGFRRRSVLSSRIRRSSTWLLVREFHLGYHHRDREKRVYVKEYVRESFIQADYQSRDLMVNDSGIYSRLPKTGI